MRRTVLTLVVSLACFAPVSTQSPAVPTPESSLGFKPGDDYKLATYDESIDYFKKLDAASDRLTLVEVGHDLVRAARTTSRSISSAGEPGQRRAIPRRSRSGSRIRRG